MKGMVPHSALDDDSIPRFGSCKMVMNLEPARHAAAGVAFVIRIFA